MKTKFFLAAAMVAFSFAMISCGGNKTANSEAATDSTSVAVEAVESAATCCKGDSAVCDSCCAAQTEQVCDSAKACCKDKAACDQKTECPQNANCEKKACDKK